LPNFEKTTHAAQRKMLAQMELMAGMSFSEHPPDNIARRIFSGGCRRKRKRRSAYLDEDGPAPGQG